MMYEKDKLIFRYLDSNRDVPPPTSALAIWYIDIRDTEISELSDNDLARACRQKLFPNAVVPICLERLERLTSDPLKRDLYDGEMLVSLNSTPSEYWAEHQREAERLDEIIDKVLSDGSYDDDRKELMSLKSKLAR
jgi:hypothetical protein